jgi:hypothetical protein
VGQSGRARAEIETGGEESSGGEGRRGIERDREGFE